MDALIFRERKILGTICDRAVQRQLQYARYSWSVYPGFLLC